jgi:hypothetical protein
MGFRGFVFNKNAKNTFLSPKCKNGSPAKRVISPPISRDFTGKKGDFTDLVKFMLFFGIIIVKYFGNSP